MHFLKSLVFAIALVDTGVAFIHRAAMDFKKHEYHFNLPVNVIDVLLMPFIETAFVLAGFFLFDLNVYLSLIAFFACIIRFLTVKGFLEIKTWNEVRVVQTGYYLPKLYLWYLYFML